MFLPIVARLIGWDVRPLVLAGLVRAVRLTGVEAAWYGARGGPPTSHVRMTTPSLQTQSDLPTGGTARGSRPATARSLLRVSAFAWPYAVVALAVTALYLPMLEFPFGSDQAIFAEIGRTMWRGGVPYVDAWDQKPPAIYAIYALGIRGPLGLMRNLRVFDLAWLLATCLVLVELGRRWWSLPAGAIAGVLYGAVYATTTGYWYSAQPDSFMALPLALALLFYDLAARQAARGPDRREFEPRHLWLLLAGGALGVAFQLRFIVVLIIPFLPMVELTGLSWRGRARLWWDRMLWLGAGFALVQGAVLLYLVAGGALDDYIEATRFAAGYTRLGGHYAPEGLTTGKYLEQVRLAFLFWALGKLILTAPAIVGGFLAVFVLRERRAQQLVLFVLLANAGIMAQAKFFPYHYLYVVPFLALLAGWAWVRAFALLARARGRAMVAAGGALLVVLLGLSTPEVVDGAWLQWKSYVEFHRRPETRELYYDFFGPWNGGPYSYRASRETAYYVGRRTQPGEHIYVWGYDPLIYLLADRPSSSRFIYSFPLMSDWAPRSWSDEFMAELHARPPAYFLVQRYEGARWITGHIVDTGEYISWFPALDAWLKSNYRLETEIEDYLIYRRVG